MQTAATLVGGGLGGEAVSAAPSPHLAYAPTTSVMPCALTRVRLMVRSCFLLMRFSLVGSEICSGAAMGVCLCNVRSSRSSSSNNHHYLRGCSKAPIIIIGILQSIPVNSYSRQSWPQPTKTHHLVAGALQQVLRLPSLLGLTALPQLGSGRRPRLLRPL